MSSLTTKAAVQYRLGEWAAQIRDCQNRPEGMSVVQWCSQNGITKANYYYRLRRVRKSCLEDLPEEMIRFWPEDIHNPPPVKMTMPGAAAVCHILVLPL